MANEINRQWILRRRPKGKLQESDFEFRETPLPESGPGQVLTRTLYLSLDPANRMWMNAAPSYRPPVEVGGPMDGFTVAQVVASNDPSFQPGDLVESENGWQDYAVLPAASVVKVRARSPLSHRVSVYGVTGLTAYFGLLEIGRPQAGETVVVSGAAGATGSVAGQIARIKGCRVVGIAGTDEKCRWLTDDLGFAAAINYKTEQVGKALPGCCPDGIDVYFDNVGGETLQAAMFNMNRGGRIVCCGAVSSYDSGQWNSPVGVPGLLIQRRFRMDGFIVLDYYDRREAAEDELVAWVNDGRLISREDIIDGLEQAPRALIGLLHGENIGKRMIRVAPDP